jgi:hypothetical protein
LVAEVLVVQQMQSQTAPLVQIPFLELQLLRAVAGAEKVLLAVDLV